jgi:DNA-binding transcriptional MerR regulator
MEFQHRLGAREVAAMSGVPPEDVERLIQAGFLTPGTGDERFTQGDVHRVRLLLACERAGLSTERIIAAIGEGRFSLSYVDAQYSFVPGPAGETFAAACERLGIRLISASEPSRRRGSLRRRPTLRPPRTTSPSSPARPSQCDRASRRTPAATSRGSTERAFGE